MCVMEKSTRQKENSSLVSRTAPLFEIIIHKNIMNLALQPNIVFITNVAFDVPGFIVCSMKGHKFIELPKFF